MRHEYHTGLCGLSVKQIHCQFAHSATQAEPLFVRSGGSSWFRVGRSVSGAFHLLAPACYL
jgi:hypothetical protein